MKSIQLLHHTHWDREWYESFATYQMKLKKGILYVLELLDQKEINTFFFDGQTVIIEDAKEVLCDHDFERFVAYIKKGVIEVGPWYVLGDGFLSDGESYFKNLEIGMKLAKQFNQTPYFGYFPDTFGHISQIPQILQIANIKIAFIHRGSISDTCLNRWYGVDGSVVNTYVLPTKEGYYQDYFHIERSQFINKISAYFDQFHKSNDTSYLLMNGCDHTFLSRDYHSKLARIESTFPYKVQETKMFDFLSNQDYQNANEIFGEQINPNKAFVLQGTLSTRMYLKQMYYENIHWLVNVLEPLLVTLDAYDANQKTLDKVWKQQLLNIGHDSICGCSIDTVHREMETRLKSVKDSIFACMHEEVYQAMPYSLHSLGNSDLYLYIFNPKVDAKRLYQVHVTLPVQDTVQDICLYRNGNEIDVEIVAKHEGEKLYAEYDQAPQYKNVVEYQIRFYDEANTVGMYCYEIKLVASRKVKTLETITKLENDYYCLDVKEGQVQLLRKRDRKCFKELIQFIHSHDCGDSYNFDKPTFDVISKAKLKSYTFSNGKHAKKLELIYNVEAASAILDRTEGRLAATRSMDIQVEITLDKTANIQVRVKYLNVYSDCKIRIAFQTDSTYIYANTAFDLSKRELMNKVYKKATGGIEADWYTFMSLNHLYQDQQAIQIAHDGCVEVELEENYVCLTLTRAIGWLSRRDLFSRDGGAGPTLECLDAQCLRNHMYSFVLNYDQNQYDANLYKCVYPLYTWITETKRACKPLYDLSNPSIGISKVTPENIRIFNETDVIQEYNWNGLHKQVQAKKISSEDRKEMQYDERRN